MGKRAAISSRIPKELKARLVAAGRRQGRSESWIVTNALEMFLPFVEIGIGPEAMERYKALMAEGGPGLARVFLSFCLNTLDRMEGFSAEYIGEVFRNAESDEKF